MQYDRTINSVLKIVSQEDDFSDDVRHLDTRYIYNKKKKIFIDSKLSVPYLTSKKADLEYIALHFDESPIFVRDMNYVWDEGTSHIRFNFTAKARLTLQQTDNFPQFILRLRGDKSPETALYSLIYRELNRELREIFQEYQTIEKQKKFLDLFRNDEGKKNQSTKLNALVSRAVAVQLGISEFSVGFELQSLPPDWLKHDIRTDIKLRDTEKPRPIITHVSLHLENLQRCYGHGQLNEDAIKNRMSEAILQYVNQNLFEKTYFDLLEEFLLNHNNEYSAEKPSIKYDIKRQVSEAANEIGYSLKMFQVLPSLTLFGLIEGLTIDIDPDEEEYITKFSNGKVKIGASFSIKAKTFYKLSGVLNPEEANPELEIAKIVRGIIRDVVMAIDKKTFNLNFEEKVVPELKEKIRKTLLARYGLIVSFRHIRQCPTEDALRFLDLKKRAHFFSINVQPQADAGATDPIMIDCKFEITDLNPAQWETFEGKDFGYRANSSIWTHDKLKAAKNNYDGQDFERHLKSLAIEAELSEIASRIKNNVEPALNRISNIANRLRSAKECFALREQVEKYAKKAIMSEFGLTVAILELNPRNTDTVKFNQEKLKNEYDIEKVEREATLTAAQQSANHRLRALEKLYSAKESLLKDADPEDNEELEGINEQIEAIRGKQPDKLLRPKGSRTQEMSYGVQEASDSPLSIGEELGALLEKDD